METPIPPAPRTLAAALKIAVEDGEALLAASQGEYAFDASRWHAGAKAGKPCAVGAAGAVMARRLRADPSTELDPSNFGRAWGWVLQSIDAMYAANWVDAFETMRRRNHITTNDEHERAEPPDGCSEEEDADAEMYGWAEDWREAGEDIRELDFLFAQDVEWEVQEAGQDLAGAWYRAAGFGNADQYRAFLDLARRRILPIVERCERETLTGARNTDADGPDRERTN